MGKYREYYGKIKHEKIEMVGKSKAKSMWNAKYIMGKVKRRSAVRHRGEGKQKKNKKNVLAQSVKKELSKSF